MKVFLPILLVFSILAAPGLAAPKEKGEETLGPSGLPIPRFVSISTDKANLRTGPGEQYPIMWVYHKKFYPLEVIGEYESWRQVRDIDGTEGWIHVVLLSGKRTGLITGGLRVLYDAPDPTAPPVARVEAGVVGEILECQQEWCRIDVGPEDGWIDVSGLWGTYIGEVIE